MRTLIGLVALVLVLALVGWISFSSDGERMSVNIEKQEIREDTDAMVESGKELVTDINSSIDNERDTMTDDTTAPNVDADIDVDALSSDDATIETPERSTE